MFTSDAGLQRIAVTGLSYRSTPLDLRERFAVPAERQLEVIGRLLALPAVTEAALISTCNRLEIVTAGTLSASAGRSCPPELEQTFELISGHDRPVFAPGLYHLTGEEAVSHLFRVAAGLDSMVVGEPQILGQLKRSYEVALECGGAGKFLTKLFHRAFGAAKSVRTHTDISRNAVSVCYLARELAAQIFGDLASAQVMMIGAGETGQLALRHFRSAGVKRFYIVNNTLSRAVEVAEELQGVPLGLRDCAAFLSSADIVVGASSIGSDAAHLLSQGDVRTSLRLRPGRPQFFIDLAVPRNFDPAIQELPDAFLYNIDDLEGLARKNLDSRLVEAERAEVMVAAEVEKFLRWMELCSVEPAIRDLRRLFSEFGERELYKTLLRLRREGLPEGELERCLPALRDLVSGLVAKTLHRPLAALKDGRCSEKTLREIFGLGRGEQDNVEENMIELARPDHTSSPFNASSRR